MKKYWWLFVLVLIFSFVGGVIFLSNKENSPVSSESNSLPIYEYYWSKTCPHCANVEEFLSSWDKKDTIQLKKMEILTNQFNSQSMIKRANDCGLPSNEVGVPFLYTPDGQCLTGDTPIIEYFQNLGN